MKENKVKLSTKIISVISLVAVLIILGVLCVGYYKKSTVKIQNPIVTMEVEKYGTIKMELYPEVAPNTVKHFIKLVNNGFYNEKTFHRVVKDFMIQTGYTEGTAQLGYLYGNDNEEQYSIKGEFAANGFTKNNLNLTEGTLAMARASYNETINPSLTEEAYNSAGTQFFIMTTDTHTALSGYYAGFGKVIEGMDVVKKISEVKVTDNDKASPQQDGSKEQSKPKKDIKIKSVTVDTFGIDYGMPETMKPFDYMSYLYSMYGGSTN